MVNVYAWGLGEVQPIRVPCGLGTAWLSCAGYARRQGLVRSLSTQLAVAPWTCRRLDVELGTSHGSPSLGADLMVADPEPIEAGAPAADPDAPAPKGKVAKKIRKQVRRGLRRRSVDPKAPPPRVPPRRSTSIRPAPRLVARKAPPEIDDLLSSPLGVIWSTDALAHGDKLPAFDDEHPGIIAKLPRRELIQFDEATGAAPPMVKELAFRAGFFHAVGRLLVWLLGLTRFFGGTLWDSVKGRQSMERRAVRLREVLERLGPTFIKVGQQLSIRADFLPYTYCRELAKMLDAVPPFHVDDAIAAIEASTGEPLGKTFVVFDKDPIGSASLACVYQAYLRSGDRVAVKVRRPQIIETIAGDLRALGWLMSLSELIGAIRPGITRNFRLELYSMFHEELNFRKEARYTDLFRRRAKKNKQRQVSAPRVFFDLCGDDVIVSEFISGVFLSEILGALDRDDTEALQYLSTLGYDPVAIAKLLNRTFNWEILEGLLFHADPHPANIVVRPDNSLVFLDFGSCGRIPSKVRHLWAQLQIHIANEDVAQMVSVSVSLLEPLPPLDVDRLTKEIEALYWDWLFAVKSKDAEWWERASGALWVKLVSIARRNQIPMNLDTLRMFRATFLYDSITFRLWSELSLTREFKKYSKGAARRSRKRISRAIDKRVRRGGLTRGDYQRIENLMGIGQNIINRTQYLLDQPEHRFTSMLGKASYSFAVALRLLKVAILLHVLLLLPLAIYNYAIGDPANTLNTAELFLRMLESPLYQLLMAGIALIIIHKSQMRIEDVDIDTN